MATIDVISRTTLVIMATIMMTSTPSNAETWTKDIKVPYYSSAEMRCHENLTVIPDASSVFWITPQAQLLTRTTDPKDFPPNTQLVSGHISVINVSQVDDAVFGYYTCVMVKSDGQVSIARWGLNVDGADFSRLEEEYRKNAVVGAIAACVMVVLLGVGCLVWHFRFSKRARGEQAQHDTLEAEKKAAAASAASVSASANVFHNRGYDDPLPEVVASEGETPGEQKDSIYEIQADTQENDGSQSFHL